MFISVRKARIFPRTFQAILKANYLINVPNIVAHWSIKFAGWITGIDVSLFVAISH
jgi:hypothetical protein